MEQDNVQTPLEQLTRLMDKHKAVAHTEVTISLELVGQILAECHTLTEHCHAAQVQLMQSEKMTTLGNLMAGIAHEISTPVASINSNVDLFARSIDRIQAMLTDESMPEEVRGNRRITGMMDVLSKLNQANQTACDRILQVIRSLRSSLHGGVTELREVDIHEELEIALTLVHHELKRRIEVVRKYGELPKCNCFPALLNSVFVNMLVNAAQAIEGAGQITIETSVTDDIIKVKFTDTGVGIPAENLEKLFEPGFTTKAPDEGTGLGLVICSRIMEKHNGKIEVESEVGVGTTFTIHLPVDQDAQCCNV